MSDATVTRAIADAWAQRFGTTRPRHMSFVTPARARRHLVPPVVAAVLRGAEPGVVQKTVDDTLQEGGWSAVDELITLAEDWAEAAWTRFVDLPNGSRPERTGRQQVGEKACVVVARVAERPRNVWATSLRTSLDDYCDGAVERHDRAAALLDDEQFVRRYESLYDELWNRRDRDGTVEKVPLGASGKPPMRRDPSWARPGDWTLGTERSVVDRYRHYRDAGMSETSRATVTEKAGLPPGQHMSVRLRHADPDSLARTEVARACSPAGLALPGHRALLVATDAGVTGADLDGWVRPDSGRAANRRLLEQWAGLAPELPSTWDDADLIGAIREVADVWAARRTVSAGLAYAVQNAPVLDGAVTTVSSWSLAVEVGVVRRMWSRLLVREQEWDAPLVRDEAAKLVRSMFGKHLHDMVGRPTALVEPAEALLMRTDNTTYAVHRGGLDLQELVEAVRADRPGWRPAYSGAVTANGIGAREALSPSDFRRWLFDNTPAAPGTDEEDF